MPRPTTNAVDRGLPAWSRAVVTAPDFVHWMAKAEITADHEVVVSNRAGQVVARYQLEGPGTEAEDGTYSGKVGPGEYVSIREDPRCACIGYMREQR